MNPERENKNKKVFASEAAEKHRPKKSLGQHFLTDSNILEKIVRAGDVQPNDLVLEVGPGEGALTETLLQAGARVIAVEKDDSLISILQEKFKHEINTEKFFLIHGDVLDEQGQLESFFKNSNYKVVANIPYYITGKIVRFLFSLDALPNTIVLLVQNEVAKRAVSDKESLLSLSIKVFGTPHYRGKVKAGSFSPPPKVDSAILSIEDISREFFCDLDEEVFFSIVRQAFSQKRKTLLNTLFADNKERGREVLAEANLSTTVRPEEVSPVDWKKLIHFLSLTP